MSIFSGLGKRGQELAKGIIDLIDEPASAKQYIQQGTNPNFLIQQGLLAPEQINNIRSIQQAQNRYLKHSIQSPEFLMREMGFMNNPAVTSQIPQPPRNIIMPEDLEGMVLKSHLGDRTVTDKTIESMGGVDFPEPVQSRGGVGYGSSPLTPEDNYWASNLTAATSVQNAAEKLEDMFDMPVAGVYAAMGRDGNFFNQAFADALQQQVDARDLPQDAIDHFDNAMRTLHGRKDWVGLRHPDARKQLLGRDGYSQKGAGKMRTAYVLQMDKAGYKNQGFPLVQPLMNELIEPELANVNLGDSGFVIGQIGKDFGLSPNANHPSYTTGIMGRTLGGTPVSVPSRVMYPDAYKILDQAISKAGENFTASQMVKALADRHDMYQIATPQWVDSVSEWIRKNPQGTAKALMTAVGMPIALGSSEETEAAGFGGFALKALERTQRKKPTTASGWKNALKGQGVKPKELQLMGFDNEFGFRKPDITKDEVAEFLKNNEYKIRETILTDAPRYTVKGNFGEEGFTLYNPDGSVHSRYNTVSEARQKQFELNENVRLPEHEEFQLSPSDSENYREILLKDDVNATKHEEITQEIKNLNDFIDAREDQLYDGILDAGGGQSELTQAKLNDPQVLDAMFKIAKLQQDRAEIPYPFLTSHFDGQENILSHLRVADRQAVDNSNTLMVEEIQSDMHQRGSKVGYSKQPEINAMRDRRDALQEESDELTTGKWSITGWAEKNMPEELDKLYMTGDESETIAGAAGRKILEARNKAYRQEFGESFIDRLGNVDRQLDNLRDKITTAEIAVPDMPFKSGDKSSWYDLAFKRALVDAAEGDYDSISFTTGKTQGERWKGAADIKGVVNFYDRTLKNHINNWAKQYGVKLTPTKLKADNVGYEVRYEDDIGWHIVDDDNIKVEDYVNTEREAYEWIADKTGQEVLTLPITDKMRKELKDKGVSLFSSPLVSGVAGAGVVGAATTSPVADANEARTQGLLQNISSRKDIAERAGAVPDLTAGLLEQTGRDIINFGAGVINPDYADIAEGGMFPVTEKGKSALSKAGEVFMDKVAPTLVKAGKGLLDFQPMFGGTLREQLGMVREQYNKLPDSVKEEITPRLGYAGLLALTLSPAAKPVKKAVKKRKKTKQQ